jgi:uncharacterized protein YkwD
MKKIIILIVLALTGLAVFFFYPQIFTKLSQVEKGALDLIQEAQKQIFIPKPLIAEKEAKNAFLTQEGVIGLTNIERAKAGLSALKESQILDESTKIKILDMFKNQYFAHESPSGLGVGDLAESTGYDYLVIGENLALGNFENDAALVAAWMNSPGHRANILNKDYQEIGVWVQKGTYEGKTTWLAVQHFGKPLSSCPAPNEAQKLLIENKQKEITSLQNTLDSWRAELQTMNKNNRENYNQKVEEYNNLVAQYNNLSAEIKNLVAQYNQQIKAFNSCASGN